MDLTTHTLTPELGDRASELVAAAYGTVTNMRKQTFLKWSIPRVHPKALIEMTIANAVVSLITDDLVPIPDGVDIAPYVNVAAAEAFAEQRRWLGITSEGDQREYPRNPSRVPRGDVSYSTFDQYRDEQFITNGTEATHETVTLPGGVDLSVLTDEEMDLLHMLGSGLTQAEAAFHLGFVSSGKPTSTHRSFVQAKLRTIRRKVCGGGVVTQEQAARWLKARTR